MADAVHVNYGFCYLGHCLSCINVILCYVLSVAVLVLFTAAAGARVIPAYLLVGHEGRVGFLLTVCTEVGMLCTHLAHIGTPSRGTLGCVIGIPQRNECPEQEGKHIVVEGIKHLGEEVIALQLVHDYRILLLIRRILDTLLEVIHFTQVLLPMLIDLEQDDILAERLGNLLSVRII